MKNSSLIQFIVVTIMLLGVACSGIKLQQQEFSTKVDTSTRPIEYQDKGLFELAELGIYASNNFNGARLNDIVAVEDNKVKVTIEPENTPINPSPYYAFKIWADQLMDIQLELNYTDSRHRYFPKLSTDGKNWERIDSAAFTLAVDSINAFLDLELGPDTLWVAAQEIHNSSDVRNWCLDKADHPDVSFFVVGKSKAGRDLLHLEIGQGEKKNKAAILIISRQHPPEVTGYLAMQAFVEAILEDTPLSNAFREKFRALVFPLMNPDGVDLGHWRHSTAGIDLNRDWAYYRQPEIRAVVNYMVDELNAQNNKPLLGLDFHSTYDDVYYTLSEELTSNIDGYKDFWIQGIDQAFPDYTPKDSPSGANSPTSKNWFYKQLNAEGITYEIGDDTPRDFIRTKGIKSAYEMMKLLIMR